MRVIDTFQQAETAMEYVSCALCDSERFLPWATVENHHIVQCARCGLRFVNPRPVESCSSQHYDEDYYSKMTLSKERWKRYYFARQLISLASEIEDGCTLLDIGSGTGIFVDVATALGWDACGVEPSTWAANYARDERGLDVRCCSADDLHPSDQRFDVITMWEILEHTHDPLSTVANARALLRDNGVLVLSVPNVRGLVGFFKWPEELMPWYHQYHFSPRTISGLVEAAGLRVVKLKTITVNGVRACLEAACRDGTTTRAAPGVLARLGARVWLAALNIPLASRVSKVVLRILQADDRTILYARKSRGCTEGDSRGVEP